MLEAKNKEKNLRLVIEHDEYAGYYVYVFEYKSDQCHQDYLYDNLEQAYNAIQKKFDITKDEFSELK
jgi:hypothetical protein